MSQIYARQLFFSAGRCGRGEAAVPGVLVGTRLHFARDSGPDSGIFIISFNLGKQTR